MVACCKVLEGAMDWVEADPEGVNADTVRDDVVDDVR